MSRLPIRSERVEQQHIVQLARTLGASVYVLGTVRRKGDYQVTMQTPGLPDLFIFWPSADWPSCCWWEVKRTGGKRSREQLDFELRCQASGVPYGWGTYDEFLEWCRAHGRLRGEVGRTT